MGVAVQCKIVFTLCCKSSRSILLHQIIPPKVSVILDIYMILIMHDCTQYQLFKHLLNFLTLVVVCINLNYQVLVGQDDRGKMTYASSCPDLW